MKLTDELTQRVVARIKECSAHPLVACVAEGISRASFYSWRKQGLEGIEPYASFWTAVTRADAELECDLGQRARQGDGMGIGHGPSKAALEKLKLRFPKRWSPQVKVEMADSLGKLLDAAERVLDRDSYEKLLGALAEEEMGGSELESAAELH